jgi:histidinol phosphatase-like PHP family hydrolase
MARLIKLDLHTHPIEALKEQMGIKGIKDINKQVAEAIVKAIKSAGINGIAITEHNNFNHGWVAALEIREHFHRENIIVLPGAEIDLLGQQFLQIYVPDYYRRRIPFFREKEWFIVLAHPGYYNPLIQNEISRVSFDAVEGNSLHGEFQYAREIARERGLPVITSSDAHTLAGIGHGYTEMELR